MKPEPIQAKEKTTDAPTEARLAQQRLSALHAVTVAANQSLRLDTVLHAVCKEITGIFHFDSTRIFLAAEPAGELALKALYNRQGGSFQHGSGGLAHAARVLETGEPFVFNDLRTDPRYPILSRDKSGLKRGIRFLAGFPVKAREMTIGVIVCVGLVPHQIDAEESKLLAAMANQVGVAITNSRLYEDSTRQEKRLRDQSTQLRQATEQLAALHGIAVAANQSPELETIAQKVVDKIAAMLHLDATRMFLLDEAKNRFRLMAAETPGRIPYPTEGPRRRGVLATAVDSGAPVIFQDLQNDPRYPQISNGKSTQKQGLRFLAAFPVQVRGKVVGVIVCKNRSPRWLAPEEIQLISTMAGQVGIAIENARILQDAKQQAQELAALHGIASALSGTLDLNQILQKAFDAILDVTAMEAGCIRLLEGDPPHLNLKLHAGMSATMAELVGRGPRPGGRSERVLSGKPSTIVENNPSLESQDHRTKTLAKAFTTFAWVAIATKERALGIINVGTRGDRTLSRSQISLLESIGASLGVALENATLYRESQRKEEIQRIVKELSQDITLLDIDTLLAKLTAQVIQLLKVDLADIRMLAGESWQVKCLSGIDPRAIPPADFIPEGRSEWIVKNRRALMIPDITRHTEIPGGKTLKRIGIRGYLGVPLFSRKGEVMGVLRALTYQSRGFAQDEIELLQQFANGAAVAIENTLLFEQVQAGHEQMQRLSRRLVEAQETERRAIARELHDEIGQILTGLKLMLQTGDGLSAKQFQKRLHKAQGLINELFTRVRALSVDLRPAMLDDLGLLPTLTWHFERFTAQTGVAVRFKHSGIQDKRFSPDLETAAYRIIQEALTNVARHANAAEAAVEVLATPQALTLEVRDRGCGFDFKAASRSGKGSGLGGMRERAMSLGGGLAIESRTERGTRLMATLPIGNIGNDPSAKGQRL